MDVTALYTSIPNNDIIIALKHFLDSRPDPHVKTDIVLRLAELALNRNTFQFDGRYYNQSRRVAMVPNCAQVSPVCLLITLKKGCLKKIYVRFLTSTKDI